MHESQLLFSLQIDHIIGLKHAGKSDLSNLASSCIRCNRNKGSDLGTVLLPELNLIPFFNPRTDDWATHFKIENFELLGITKIGKATENIFQFNATERIIERKELIKEGVFPYKKFNLE